MDEWEELARTVAIELRSAGFTRICGHPVESDIADRAEYIDLLDQSPTEQDIQRYLGQHLRLVQAERGSLCRWIKAHQEFGNQYEADFLIVRMDSNPGIRWTLVELQRPDADLYTARGRTSGQFDEGIRQIDDWRAWIGQNGDYARKPRRDSGLALTGLTAQADGLIMIGRRAVIPAEHRTKARSMTWPHRIEVHTYDWLAAEAQANIDRFGVTRDRTSQTCEECDPIGDVTGGAA